MKTPFITRAHGLLRLGFFAALCILVSPGARARTITLTLDFSRLQYSAIDPNYRGYTYYTVNILVSSDVPPVTYDEVDSPIPAYSGTESGSGETLFGDLGSALNAATNGLWTLTVNKGDVSQKQYTFTVSASEFSTNSFPVVQITTPADGSRAVSTNSSFNWSGPASWDELDLADHSLDYSFYTSEYPSPSTTSWNAAPLPLGTNEFEVTYQTNGAPWFTISTPVDDLSNPFTNWVGGSKLFDFVQSGFVTSTNPAVPAGTNSALIAHYTFDNGVNLGQDSSGNGYDLNYNGDPYGGGVTSSADAETGGGAAYFDGGSFFSYTSAPSQVLNTLAGNFTLSFWINTEQNDGNEGGEAYAGAGIVAADVPGQANDIVPAALDGGEIGINTGPDDDTLNSMADINDGNYHHVVVTRNQATGEKRIYIDGVLDNNDFDNTLLLNDPKLVAIGCQIDASQSDPDDANPSQFFQGLLDDIQLYSVVLSADQVAQLYANPGSIASAGPDFNPALNTTNLTWLTGGDSDWFVETTNTSDGVSAAQSGIVINNQSSTLSVTVTGPGTLTFSWACMADDTAFDYEVYTDGDPNNGYMDDLYYNTGWYQDGPFNIPAGTHTISWTAFAYGDEDPTEAGFLDQVSFLPYSPPVVTGNPFNQTNYPGYPVWLSASANANPAATWQWYKVSSGLIPGATSSYYIPTNSGTAEVQDSYYAIATNPAGSANTTTAAVSFVSAPLPPDWSRAFKSPFYPVYETTVTKDYYYGCIVDTNGNLYIAAEFGGNTDVGAFNLDSGTGGDAAAIVKQSPTGSPLWAVGITNNGSGSSYALSVAPAPGGGVYLAGNYSGNNWLGTNQLIDTGNGDMFLASFDANGSNLWVKTFGGANGNFLIINSLASDPAGNVTLCGLLGSGPVTIGDSNYNVMGQEGVLIQLDQTGAVRWSQLLPGEWVQYLNYSAGRIYASVNTTTSGGTTNVVIGGVSNLTDRAWAIACLNGTNGQAIWIRGVGAQYGSGNGNPYAVGLIDDVPRLAVSGTNVFLTGAAYDSSASFGAITVNFDSLRGQYFARYDTNGNAQVATTYGSVTTTPVAAVADTNGNVYVSGYFDTFSFFGNDLIAAPANARPYNGGFSQAFLGKFDRNGNPLWAREAVSPATVNLLGIALAADGVWASGWSLSGQTPPIESTAFGTNNVFSDAQFLEGGEGGGVIILWYPAGVLAKITDNSTIGLPVTILNPQDNGANFQFSFQSQSGFMHAVQYRTNLSGGNWQTYSNVAGDSTLKTIPVPFAVFGPSQQGFIRVSTQ